MNDVTARSFELVLEAATPRVIRGRVETPTDVSGPLPHVVIVHGFKGFMNWGFFPELSRRIAARCFCVVSFNMSGSGIGPDLENFTEDGAFERNSMSAELEDLAEVSRFAATLPEADAQRRALVGHSFGGGLSILHAEETGGWDGIVAWAPVATLDRFPPKAKEMLRAAGRLPIPNARTGQVHHIGIGWLEDLEANLSGRFGVVAAASRLETPVWILHGKDDESVGFEEGARLAEALPNGELIEFEAAGHAFGARHPLVQIPPVLERAFEVTLGALDATFGRSRAGHAGPLRT